MAGLVLLPRQHLRAAASSTAGHIGVLLLQVAVEGCQLLGTAARYHSVLRSGPSQCTCQRCVPTDPAAQPRPIAVEAAA